MKTIEEKIAEYYDLDEAKGSTEIQLKIMKLLYDQPSPADDVIHAFAEKEKMDVHKFESFIYDILGSIIGAGRAKEKGFEEKDADSKELKMGIKIEMEHTTNSIISKRIALDHLAEIPDYYTRLIKMEKDAGIED